MMVNDWSMDTLNLTTSFRCPAAVTDLAQARAPDMTAPEWAKPGSVTLHGTWSLASLPDQCTVICRNNAPLFRLAMQLIKARRRPHLAGRDILKQLHSKMKRLGHVDIRNPQLLVEIESWYQRERKRFRDSTIVRGHP